MNNVKMLFGERLRRLRENKELTQENVSSSLHITRAVLSNYERGLREPDFQTLLNISDFFGVTVDYLLGKTDLPGGDTGFVDPGFRAMLEFYLFHSSPQSREDLKEYVDFLKFRDQKRREQAKAEKHTS